MVRDNETKKEMRDRLFAGRRQNSLRRLVKKRGYMFIYTMYVCVAPVKKNLHV